MENHETVRGILQKFFFMAKLDLKEAYFMLSVNKSERKFLRFVFQGQIYKFNCLPFGFNCAPLIFTKLMKPVVSHLREKGFLSVIYLDDLLLLGSSYKGCKENVS